MFCPHCGAKNSDSAAFCSKCGKTFGTEIEPIASNAQASSSKSLALALIISFIFTGLGIAYAGNVGKGVILFVVSLICNIIGLIFLDLFALIGIGLWIYGLYATYQMFKA